MSIVKDLNVRFQFDCFKPTEPPVVKRTVDFLLNHGLECEGLFRVSAEYRLVYALSSKLEKNKTIDIDTDEDPHVVCGVLLTYFSKIDRRFLTNGL